MKPLFDQYRTEIARYEWLFNKPMLASQNITTWEYCLNENLVRAVSAVLIKSTRGNEAYAEELGEQVNRRGFTYTKAVADLIAFEYVGSDKYGNFDDFFPQILKALDKLPDFGGKPIRRYPS